MIIETHFHGQNVKKHKKDKIITHSFPKSVSFHHLSVQEELRTSEIFFAILLVRYSLAAEKEFFIFIKNKKDKKVNNWVGFLSRK